MGIDANKVQMPPGRQDGSWYQYHLEYDAGSQDFVYLPARDLGCQLSGTLDAGIYGLPGGQTLLYAWVHCALKVFSNRPFRRQRGGFDL